MSGHLNSSHHLILPVIAFEEIRYLTRFVHLFVEMFKSYIHLVTDDLKVFSLIRRTFSKSEVMLGNVNVKFLNFI